MWITIAIISLTIIGYVVYKIYEISKMTPEQRKLEDERIRHARMNGYEDYMTFCEQDEELAKLYDELKAFSSVGVSIF